VPRLLAMLCILAVFIPAFFMQGAGKALFVPLALAVGFAMVASYLLSSTLVPILSIWFLRGTHAPRLPRPAHLPDAPGGSPHSEAAAPVQDAPFFARLQSTYSGLLNRMMPARWLVIWVYLVIAGLVIWLVGARLGTEIFPRVDTGQLQIRLRAPTGTKIEATRDIALHTLDLIRDEAGRMSGQSNCVAITLGFVGVHAPNYPIDLIYLWNGGTEEGVVQVQLKPGTPVRIEDLKERLRHVFADKMPDIKYSFEPSDIVSRVMSFGANTPIEIAVAGQNLTVNRDFAEKIRAQLEKIPSLRDIQFGQALDYPTVDVNVNRERAGLMGVRTSDATRALVAATSSSRFTQPVYWADPNSGVSYQVQGGAAGKNELARRREEHSRCLPRRPGAPDAQHRERFKRHRRRPVRPL